MRILSHISDELDVNVKDCPMKCNEFENFCKQQCNVLSKYCDRHLSLLTLKENGKNCF